MKENITIIKQKEKELINGERYVREWIKSKKEGKGYFILMIIVDMKVIGKMIKRRKRSLLL